MQATTKVKELFLTSLPDKKDCKEMPSTLCALLQRSSRILCSIALTEYTEF